VTQKLKDYTFWGHMSAPWVVCQLCYRQMIQVMHDGMQYDPIQGQGHEPFKVGNSTIFKGHLLPIYNGGWQMTTDS